MSSTRSPEPPVCEENEASLIASEGAPAPGMSSRSRLEVGACVFLVTPFLAEVPVGPSRTIANNNDSSLQGLLNSLPHEFSPGESATFMDGLCGSSTDDGKWVITSPTCEYIPSPEIGVLDISLGPDGHFRRADPLIHPQALQEDTKFPWLAAVRREIRDPEHELRILWHVLTADDVCSPSNSIAGGSLTIKESLLQKFATPMKEAVTLIRQHEELNGKNRELGWQSSAYLDVEKRPFPMIKANSTHAKVSAISTVQMGLERIHKESADLSIPPSVLQPGLPRTGNGVSGPHRARNVLSVPRTKPYSPRPISDSDMKKFQPYSHPCFPPPLPAWQNALSTVVPLRKIAADDQWGYWVPEARLVVASTTDDRQRRHVQNWLRVRPLWLSGLSSFSTNHPGPLRASQWREYLGASSTWEQQLHANSKRANFNRDVASLFKTVLGPEGFAREVPSQVFGVDVFTEDREKWVGLCKMVAWELIQIGFRYELTELDRRLLPLDDDRERMISDIFPASHGVQIQQFPSWSRGLGADSKELRAPYLDALRRLMLRWPGLPDILKQFTFKGLISDDDYTRLEIQLLSVYCQRFFDCSGRPPTILYGIPV
ncbi:hypothetical protein EIP86_010714 [Pleurotus ostreatoroseus]|nr:hypothetical protein EIP86_010714 [Pleurotus ostreatoroseus]